MSEIRFYHLERQTLDQVLPMLLAKALEGGRRAVVKARDAREVQRLNDHLWAYSPDSFLPHGSEKEGQAENQPVWITTEDEKPNGADVLILTDGTNSEMLDQFALCCDVFDGSNEAALSQARARWKAYKDTEHELTYWQQGQGGWEKKA